MPNFLDTVSSLFGSNDPLPWTDSDIIQSCDREAAAEGVGVSKESGRTESYMRLSWALVHSRQLADVQRGILMLEAALLGKPVQAQEREVLYLLAVGHYRAGDIGRARQYVDRAMEIAPDFRQGATLRKVIEDKIAKDGVIGIGITAAAVGIVASGIAALVARRR